MLPTGWMLCVTCFLRLASYFLCLAAWFLLLAFRYLILATCYMLFVTFYLLLATYYLILAIWYLLLSSWFFQLETCLLLLATYYLQLTTCYLLLATYCLQQTSKPTLLFLVLDLIWLKLSQPSKLGFSWSWDRAWRKSPLIMLWDVAFKRLVAVQLSKPLRLWSRCHLYWVCHSVTNHFKADFSPRNLFTLIMFGKHCPDLQTLNLMITYKYLNHTNNTWIYIELPQESLHLLIKKKFVWI